MLSNRISKMLLSGAVLGATAGAVNAGLNIDVRATGVSGGGALNGAKSVTGVVPGSVVSFDVFAVVTGTDASTGNDKFISVAGSFRSNVGTGTTGTLLMDLVRSTVDSDGIITSAGFDGLGSSVGLQQDLDGDGDLDVGSNTDSDANNFWAARYALAPGAIPSGSLSPTTGGRRIGFGTFTVTAAGVIPTLINFDGRGASTAANYVQDGQTVQEASVDGLVPISVSGVPEPTTLSLAALAGLGLIRRRRA
jgi:MYXO-CTERM domain-containing protein